MADGRTGYTVHYMYIYCILYKANTYYKVGWDRTGSEDVKLLARYGKITPGTYIQAKYTPHLSCLGNAETNWSRHSQTSDVCQHKHLDERWQACFHNPNHFDSKYPVSDRSRWSVSGLRVAPAALRFSLSLAENLLTRATTGHAHEYTSITLKPTWAVEQPLSSS